MVGDWRETIIGEQVRLQRGYDITKVHQRAGQVPVVSAAGILSYHDTAMAKGPGVILGRKGNGIGRAHFVLQDYWPHDTTLWVTDFKGNDPHFVFYFFTQMFGRLQSMDVGSANPTLNRNHVHPIRVTWPPLSEQQAIACILGVLDDKIELNRRRSRTLEAMARAIFQSWFVDFEPVRAKAAGRTPAGLSPDLAALFPESFEESALGLIPKGWRVGTVGNNFRLTVGQSPPGNTYNEAGNGLPFYQGRTDFGFRFPTRRVYCTEPTRLADPGDTLVSVRAPVGDVNIAIERCAIGRGVAAVRHLRGNRSLTYHTMHSLQDRFATFEAEGTVFGSINKSDFRKLPLIEAANAVIDGFDRLVSPLDDRVEASERESATLAALRDVLLPKLISGELRVPDAERIVGRAT